MPYNYLLDPKVRHLPYPSHHFRDTTVQNAFLLILKAVSNAQQGCIYLI